MSMKWPPRRWRTVRKARARLGLPCAPAACIRTGQFGANCECTKLNTRHRGSN